MAKRVERKHDRIEFRRPCFVILEPDAPWIECAIADISEGVFASKLAPSSCRKSSFSC